MGKSLHLTSQRKMCEAWSGSKQKHLASQVTREMQIRTTIPLLPIRMAKIKKTEILIVGKYVGQLNSRSLPLGK